jgi:hypothetical protein
MTTARISAGSQSRSSLDLAVARLAETLLRWSNRRAIRASITHEEISSLRETERATQNRPFYSTLVP